MKETKKLRLRRSLKDYNLGFKLAVIDQVEKGNLACKHAQKLYVIQGPSSALDWLQKHGNLSGLAKKYHAEVSRISSNKVKQA